MSTDERDWYRWLRQQLTDELGVQFRGAPRILPPEVVIEVRKDVASCLRGERTLAYRRWAQRLNVSYSTIQRSVHRWAGRYPRMRLPSSSQFARTLVEY